jgi:tetratricopeptide (TPR) repeat protein
MDHPAIARVFDAGATPEGRPYFAMELVDGPPLTDYCDAGRLPVARRLELFVAVCRAVHSAHQKGIIHRDLKASNVLVATAGGEPMPKVIDFGIARAIDPRLVRGTLLTHVGVLVGTPEAMSPEQAEMSLDLDTRADVYSLGALLYELLTGEGAFDFERTTFVEILRRIREEEPLPPSARFGPQASREEPEDTRERAHRRGGDPARLRRELAGELDWIVARAMAKERERRYGSAAELADDLERHLAHEPVLAGPPSRVYRMQKFLRRHRLEAAAAALLLVAIVGFGVAMAVQSRRLAKALEVQEKERRTATQVSEFLVALLEQPDPAVARGEDMTVRQVLDRGAGWIERDLADQPEIRARLLATVGRVSLNLGAYDKAEPILRRVLELRRQLHGPEHAEVAQALQRLGELEFERGRFDPARALGEEALALRRRLLPAGDPAVAESLDLAALVARESGDLERAASLHTEALAIRLAAFDAGDPAVAESYNYIGIVRRRGDDLAGAEEAYRRALDIWRKSLGADHPKTAMAMNNLALTVHVRGDYRAAEAIFAELVPLRRKLLGDEHPDLLLTLNNQAKLLHDMGELERAAELYDESLATGRRSVGESHPQMATALADSSAVLAKLGRTDEALARAQRALAIREATFGSDHTAVAATLAYLAQVHEARGDDLLAAPLHARAVGILRRHAPGQPRFADALDTYANFLLRTGDAASALALLEEAVAIQRARLPPADRRRARTESSLGACLTRLGRYDEAEALLTESLVRLEAYETADTTRARERLTELRRAQGRSG